MIGHALVTAARAAGCAAAVATGLLWSQPASAGHLTGVEPPASLIVTRGDFQWVWASPCAGLEPTCEAVTLHHDFGFATDEIWLESFSSLTDLVNAFTDVNGAPICAAEYFSASFHSCDQVDVLFGFVWHSPFAPTEFEREHFQADTFLVRYRPGSGEPGPTPMPEPAALALAGLGLIGVAGIRRRKSRRVAA